MEKQEYALMAKLQDSHWWFVGRRNIVQSVIQKIALPKAASILEIGCGMGGNLALLQSFGTVYASDVEHDAVAYSQSLGIAKAVIPATLPDEFPFPQQSFDLVVMLDVLEHIDNDVATLQSIKQHLNAKGTLLITVPAYQFLWSAHDEFLHHKRRYTKTSLERAIAAAGLKVQYISYFNIALFFPIAAIRLLSKFLCCNRKREITSDLEPVRPGINALLKAVFSSERYAIGRCRFPFGVSLIATVSV